MNARLVLILAALATGCSTGAAISIIDDMPEADLTDRESVEMIGGIGSPVAVYALGEAYSGVDLLDDEVYDPGCARVSDNRDDNGVGTVDMGFEDCEGHADEYMDGAISITVAADGSVKSVMDDVTSTLVEYCDDGTEIPSTVRWSGTWELDASGSFHLDLVLEAQVVDYESCEVTNHEIAIDYSGKQEGSLDDWDATASGSGEIGWLPYGKAKVETRDEVIDGTCPYEALSGTTTLRSGGHEATIHFDGDTDCNGGESRWSLDGEDQGAIGVTCSSTTSSAGLVGLALGVLAVGLRRRRRIASRGR